MSMWYVQKVKDVTKAFGLKTRRDRFPRSSLRWEANIPNSIPEVQEGIWGQSWLMGSLT